MQRTFPTLILIGALAATLVACDTGAMDEMPTALVLPDDGALETSGELMDELPTDPAADPTSTEPNSEPAEAADEPSEPTTGDGTESDREPFLLPTAEDAGDKPQTSPEPEVDPDVSEEPTGDLCMGSADQETIHSQPGPALYKWVLTQVQGCFYGLGGSIQNLAVPDDDFHACISDAMEEDLGLSAPCSSCFADIGLCSKHFCTKQCGNVQISDNMNLQDCLDCQKKHYCSHTFDACIGWSMTQELELP